MSPGIIALYWALAALTATTLWIGACELTRHTSRRIGGTCPCGRHQ